MEEWKAKEKARLREAASQPKVIPQDTAFPTFASNKNDEKQAGGQGGASRRISEDHERPSTSSGRNGSRPPGSRSNNHQQRPGPSDVNGRSHQQSHSTRTPQHEQSTQSQRQTDGIGRRPVQGHNDPPPRRYIDPNPPFANMPPGMQRPQGREPPAGSQRVVSPPQTQASPPQTISAPVVKTPKVPEPQPESTSTAESDEYYPQESWRTGPPKKRPQAERPPKREASPVVPPQESGRTGSSNTTSQNPVAAQQPEVVRKPVNPPTAPPPQAEPPATYQMPSRVLSLDEQQPRSGSQPTHAPAKNFARPNVVPVVPAHEESLDDLYDDYYGAAQPQHVYVPPPPKNRDEEIEAEMPDFDSAAPGQTSGVHKRIQVVDKHPSEAHPQMPGMPPQHFNASVQPLPVHGHNPYGNYQEPAVASQPELGDIRYDGSGATDGFVFGVPGEQARPEQHYADPRQVPPNQQAMAYRPAQSVPPESMRRFQTPVDQRQMNMPMHSSPPGEHPQMQRFPPGGHGPILPKQRSASTRPPMTQTGWSDPGMQRAPTAPPMRQDSYGAPHYGPPRTGSLANQQHRAPSAPPGQQPMRGMPPPGMPRNGPPFGQQQHMRPRRPSETDALPHHPAPFRPGLMEQGAPRQPKPTPVRNYDNRSSSSSHQRQVSISDGPITNEDLEQARLDMEANKASPRLSLRYAKKLVEASHVLASEGGRLDAKATQRNREKYLNEAYKRVKELVRNTYPEAQFYMAECYGSGELGLGVDPKEAFALYQAAAKGGHAAAAFRTAVSCEIGPEEGGGTRKDYPKAVQWYRRAAALGDVAAMFKLGIILLRGLLGVPRNVGEAVSWLKRAAERADKDNPHALHELATLHEPGNPDPQVREKVIPDEAYALSLFKQAAEFGFKRSQFRLGQAYEYGSLGLDIDNRASIAWYTKAAAQGEHNAELALSGWYLTGAEGMLEQSDMEAYLWARKAAQSEPPLAKAMFAMGYFTEQGIGCPKSLEEAKRWYGRAACKCFAVFQFSLFV
jgi:TPR repeat protein